MLVNQLNLSKHSMMESVWLKSIGWKIIDAWIIKGSEPVKVKTSADRYSDHQITDQRYVEFAKTFDLFNYLGV